MPQPGHPHGHSAVYELATKVICKVFNSNLQFADFQNDANMLYSIGEDNRLFYILSTVFFINIALV